jgi:hypothetical protein
MQRSSQIVIHLRASLHLLFYFLNFFVLFYFLPNIPHSLICTLEYIYTSPFPHFNLQKQLGKHFRQSPLPPRNP